MAFAIWFIIFAASNHDAVTLALFPLPYDIILPKFLFAILCFLAGAMIAGVAVSLKTSDEQRQFKKQRRKIAAMEEEIKIIKAKEPTLPVPQD